MRDASFGLLPDFVRGGFVMRAPVGVVRILIGIEVKIGIALGILARDLDGAVGALGGIGVNDICAVCLQNPFSLGRNILRHAERDRKSESSAEHGVGDAGVAAGGIQQNLSGSEFARGASFGHNAGGGTIFDGSPGVVPFGLAQKVDVGKLCIGRLPIGKIADERVERQQGRVADAREQSFSSSI